MTREGAAHDALEAMLKGLTTQGEHAAHHSQGAEDDQSRAKAAEDDQSKAKAAKQRKVFVHTQSLIFSTAATA